MSRATQAVEEQAEEKRRQERGLLSAAYAETYSPERTSLNFALPRIDPVTRQTIPSRPYADEAPRTGTERTRRTDKVSDPVNQPAHYTGHPSGVECITITEHMGFNLGNALKYIWRCDLKADAIEDLRKAEFYIKREIEKRTKAAA